MFDSLIKNIPNTITCCNLISGCIATSYALENNPWMAVVWIIIGAAFDFFDGMSARLLKVSSAIGKELDSLADDITFGIAPAAIVFSELLVIDYPAFLEPARSILPYFAFTIAAFSALRLAKFNLDTRQTTSFIGMPTPANALFWGSLIATMHTYLNSSPYMLYIMLALIILCNWLMISEIPMFALKFKHWGWKDNELRYSFIIFSIALIVRCGFIESFWIIIPSYVYVSILANMSANLKKRNR